jgi:hypothetical protein
VRCMEAGWQLDRKAAKSGMAHYIHCLAGAAVLGAGCTQATLDEARHRLPEAPLIADAPDPFMRQLRNRDRLVLPMVFGLYAYGIAFALANAGILAIRIRAENQALQSAAAPSTELSRKA